MVMTHTHAKISRFER